MIQVTRVTQFPKKETRRINAMGMLPPEPVFEACDLHTAIWLAERVDVAK